MPFDGVNWGQGGLIPAITYQPNAGCSADMWFTALVTAYAKSRKAGRFIAGYGFPWNGVGLTGSVVSGTNIFSLSYQPCGEYDAYVETTWTHLVAMSLFTVVAEGTAYAHHQLNDYDGTTIETENYVTEVQGSNAATEEGSERSRYTVRRNVTTNIHYVQMELDITGQNRNLDHVVYLNAAATTYDTDAGNTPFPAGTEAAYYPIYHAFFLECRG